MKIKFLLGILLITILTSIMVEGRTQLSNCIDLCSDSSGCTCPSYCSTTGNINQNANCGGQVTSCLKGNRRYWIRDGGCQATCGDYDNEFMEGKGWTRVNYNCYTEEAPITEETTKEKEDITEEIIKEPEEEIVKTNFLLYMDIALTVIIVLLILWIIFRKKKKK